MCRGGAEVGGTREVLGGVHRARRIKSDLLDIGWCRLEE